MKFPTRIKSISTNIKQKKNWRVLKEKKKLPHQVIHEKEQIVLTII
jgi:hypothetical protein